MGKLSRYTIIITLTETWTIVWATADEPQRQATTIVQDNRNPKEEADETFQSTLSEAELGPPPASALIAPLTPAAPPASPPGSVPTRPPASGRSRRTRRR